MTAKTPPATLSTLMTGLIDYAGLFPPAKLPMDPVIANYADYRASDHAPMLARLIVPIARLDEFEKTAADRLAAASTDEPWRISGLIGPNLRADIDAIFAFNNRHTDADTGMTRAEIDVIELKAASAADVDAAMKIIPEQIDPFIEIDHTGDPRGLIASIAGTGARAKIRTGGVTPDAIPTIDEVARFIWCCNAAEVAFKATAGLHHPVRSEHPLTYEDGAPRATMHGFLNVFIAAALVRGLRITEEETREVIAESNPANFVFTEESVGWRDRTIELGRLVHARESFAVSFGSCSFTEPIEDLEGLGLL